MFLFGGNNYASQVLKNQANNDGTTGSNKLEYTPVYQLGMKTFAWSLLKGRGDEVASRDEHTSVLDENSSLMVVFGGFIDGERCNETAMYNAKTNYWRKAKLFENSRRPCPRSGHSSVIHNGNMYVFGGKCGNSNKLNDLWELSKITGDI